MTDMKNKLLSGIPDEEEMDLVNLARRVWNGRKLVIKTVIVVILIGFLIALFSPTEYSVTTIMIPQSSDNSLSSKLGGLSSLAAMAGFNINLSSGSGLNPLIYPQIVQSIPFQKDLMQTKLNFEGIDHPVTYYDYYMNYYSGNILGYLIGLPEKVISYFHKSNQLSVSSGSSLTTLTYNEYLLSNQLTNTVYVTVDSDDGYISLTAIMPQALAAAELAKRALNLLQQFITKINISQAKAQLDFIKGRYKVKKKEYEQAQLALANFQDENKNLSSAAAGTEQTRLNNNYQLAYGVYSQLAQQLENAQIQVKNDTPVFSIIQPVTIPNVRYTPKRTLIMIIWTFLGLLAGIGLVIGKKYWLEAKKRWKEEK